MSIRTEYPEGTPSWVDLATTDPAGAAAFYGELFGWTRSEIPAGDGGTYSMLHKDGHVVAGMMEQEPRQREAGVPPNWTTYITVDDVDRSASRVADLGGTVHAEPFDVMDSGRMAVIQDPTGAFFGLWQAKGHIGAALVDEPGAAIWHELNTRGAKLACEFYADLLDLDMSIQDMGEMGEYTTLLKGDAMVAGVMDMAPGVPDFVPPHWLVYFATDDVDATVTRAKELGGSVTADPMDIPGVGRFAVLDDPQGATFAVMTVEAPDG